MAYFYHVTGTSIVWYVYWKDKTFFIIMNWYVRQNFDSSISIEDKKYKYKRVQFIQSYSNTRYQRKLSMHILYGITRYSCFVCPPISPSCTFCEIIILKALDVSKSHGLDEIPVHVLQLYSSAVVKLLLIIFKYCLIHGNFPSNWKKSSIAPVSLLPICGKICEKIKPNWL